MLFLIFVDKSLVANIYGKIKPSICHIFYPPSILYVKATSLLSLLFCAYFDKNYEFLSFNSCMLNAWYPKECFILHILTMTQSKTAKLHNSS